MTNNHGEIDSLLQQHDLLLHLFCLFFERAKPLPQLCLVVGVFSEACCLKHQFKGLDLAAERRGPCQQFLLLSFRDALAGLGCSNSRVLGPQTFPQRRQLVFFNRQLLLYFPLAALKFLLRGNGLSLTLLCSLYSFLGPALEHILGLLNERARPDRYQQYAGAAKTEHLFYPTALTA